ncbi:hypothetical protein [Polycladidibacter hongkongensis]|uniref:hypothetical protein n=1 Tax=Polycladidibacter hongkongensis TaxID=1647556 RepID=UPI000A48945D|nr:hypothetical protein [Pseudovibrio hongkongensis]
MLPQNCFLYSKQEIIDLKKSKLFGYGLTSSAIILGSEGMDQYEAQGNSELPKEGRFIGVFLDNAQTITIRADATGQELLYLYRNGDDWAISNSFLLLAESVGKRAKLTLHAPAVLGFHLKNGVHIGEQLVSHRTAISEITIVPINAELKVDRLDGKLEVQKQPYLEMFSLRDASYEDAFINFLERGAGLLNSLMEAGLPLNLLLSGGYDSRLVLCLALAGQSAPNLRVTSYVFKEDDYRVAKSLCDMHSLELNGSAPKKPSDFSSSDAIRAYLLSCGGTYLPFYPVQSTHSKASAELRLTGDQPTGWDHFNGRAMFNGDARKLGNDIEVFLKERGCGTSVKEDFLSSFSELDLDADHPVAMLAYYSAIRSRFHCGRNWYKSLGVEFLFTPLMQSDFISLDFDNAKRGADPKKFFADAFSAFGGWALKEPFESVDREFSSSLLDNSPFKGGVSLSPAAFKIYGSIWVDENRSPDLLSINLDMDSKPELIKRDLQTMFYRARRAKASNLFISKDFAAASAEIHADGRLSHDYRKLCHILSTEVILRIIDESGQ